MLPPRVLVCGSTGRTGSAVLDQLVGRDVAVRALTRDPQAAQRLRRRGIEAVVGDLAGATELPRLLAGIKLVYVALPNTDRQLELEVALFEAAAIAGVHHVVKMSVSGADRDSPLGLAELHGRSEERLRQTGMSWTMVRATSFMQNVLGWAEMVAGGTITTPAAAAPVAFVDARDVAAVAAAALLEPAAHTGAIYELTGPDAITPREQAAIIGGVLGIELAVRDQPIQDAQAALRSAGADAFRVLRLGELWQWYADGHAPRVSPDVSRVLGRPPCSFGRFVEEHRAALSAFVR